MTDGKLNQCPSKGMPVGRGFLEACLLCLLKQESSYGYGLMEKLNLFEIDKTSFDSSVIYRNLRNMEKRALITSSWADSPLGPKKRIYSITTAGEEALAEWVDILKKRQRIFESLIQCYDTIK